MFARAILHRAVTAVSLLGMSLLCWPVLAQAPPEVAVMGEAFQAIGHGRCSRGEPAAGRSIPPIEAGLQPAQYRDAVNNTDKIGSLNIARHDDTVGHYFEGLRIP